MRKRIAAALIALIMLFTLLPLSSLADDYDFDTLVVNGTQLQVGNSKSIGKGTAELSWNADVGKLVLTLTNVSITKFTEVGEDGGCYAGIAYKGQTPLKIVCKGSCTVSGPSVSIITRIYEGLYSCGSVELCGNLSLSKVDIGFDCYNYEGSVGELKTENAVISANCELIAALCDLRMKSSELKISTSSAAGIACENSLYLEGSTLSVQAKPENAADYEGAVGVYAPLINGSSDSSINLIMDCDLGSYSDGLEIVFTGVMADTLKGSLAINAEMDITSNKYASAVGVFAEKSEFKGTISSTVNFLGEHLPSAAVEFENALMLDNSTENKSTIKASVTGANKDDVAFRADNAYPQVIIDSFYASTDNASGKAVLVGKDAFTYWYGGIETHIRIPADGVLSLYDADNKQYTVTDTNGKPATEVYITTGDVCEHLRYTVIPAVAPKCKESGFTEGKQCLLCGEIFEEPQETAPAGHKETTIPAVDPTCTGTGLTAGVKCSVCSEVIVAQKEVPALGHIEKTIAAVAPTCEKKGYTEGKVCSVCGKVLSAQKEVAALGHTEEIIPAVEPTCSSTGLTDGVKCSVCGEVLVKQTEVPMLSHTEKTVPAVAPTCTSTGLTEGKVCSVCGEVLVKQTEVPMLSHTEDKVPAVAATCTTTGLTEGKVCSVCGKVLVEQRMTYALGHVEEVLPAVEPTCTGTGLTEGMICIDCGEITSAQELIPALGHAEKLIPAAAATCAASGLTEGIVCTHCGEVVKAQEEIPALGHNFVKGKCIGCGEYLADLYFKDTGELVPSFKESIGWAVQKDVTSGYEDGTFRPNNDCTRGHVVTFLWRAAGSPKPTTDNCPFSDVKKGAYYYDAVLWAVENGITGGYEDGSFRPSAACTRAHVVTFLWRYQGRPAAAGEKIILTDISGLNADFTAAIYWAAGAGVTAGYPDGSFRPSAVCTRAHVVTFLYRCIEE